MWSVVFVGYAEGFPLYSSNHGMYYRALKHCLRGEREAEALLKMGTLKWGAAMNADLLGARGSDVAVATQN